MHNIQLDDDGRTVYVHELAYNLGNSAGLTDDEIASVITRHAETNRMLLIGGFDIDVAIMAMYIVLMGEGNVPGEQKFDNINSAIEALYVGVI
jgi:hypothetical protein